MQTSVDPIIIVGAGPAGLTAAWELAEAGHGPIIIYESTDQIGGLSQTIQYNGNRIDIGGHRFFSKSRWVMQWWQRVLPIAGELEPASLKPEGGIAHLAYQGKALDLPLPESGAAGDDVLLVRNRLSRILFGGKLFDYPLKLNLDTVRKLGLVACISYGLSYVKAQLFPRRPEATLEDFFVNRFGKKLYERFFKEYTEKVWGRSCDSISASWGAQRVKSLSIGRAVLHAVRQRLTSGGQAKETSLIEHFLYPKLGPGHMWERVADLLRARGVSVQLNSEVTGIQLSEGRVTGVTVRRAHGLESGPARAVFSTMPVKALIGAMGAAVPEPVRRIAADLEYRDFMTVGLLYRKPKGRLDARANLPDNWIYIQEPGVKVGRVQIFNNWSPYLVADQATDWVGLEYFCNEGDELWRLPDAEMKRLAVQEMEKIGLAAASDCMDGVVIRMPKAYPGYYGEAYSRFGEVQGFTDSIPNLYLIGRNGMHRYNNQDHSMLSAKAAVDAFAGTGSKDAIWAVNIDDAYHEEGTDEDAEAKA